MAQVDCGFKDDGGHLASGLLVEIGPTLKVDLGFDATYNPDHPRRLAILPMQDAQALIDTGATYSCIDADLAMQLELPIVDQQRYGGIGGEVELNIHLAQIRARSLNFTLHGRFAAVKLAAGGQRHTVLIGRDFLRHFQMHYDGLSGSVILTDPSQPMPAPEDLFGA